MSRDFLILIVMIIMVMSYSAYGQGAENNRLEEVSIELESESRGLDFRGEIERQEGQFQVVISSIKREEAGNEEALDSENNPMTVSLIKMR